MSGCWLVEEPSPAFFPESFRLEVEAEGLLPLPEELRESLGLEPGTLLSLTRNEISIRLDLYTELLEDLRLSVKPPNRWRCLEQFISRILSCIGVDGSVAIPPNLFSLRPGDRLVLEVFTQGLCHSLYVYRADG